MSNKALLILYIEGQNQRSLEQEKYFWIYHDSKYYWDKIMINFDFTLFEFHCIKLNDNMQARHKIIKNQISYIANKGFKLKNIYVIISGDHDEKNDKTVIAKRHNIANTIEKKLFDEYEKIINIKIILPIEADKKFNTEGIMSELYGAKISKHMKVKQFTTKYPTLKNFKQDWKIKSKTEFIDKIMINIKNSKHPLFIHLNSIW